MTRGRLWYSAQAATTAKGMPTHVTRVFCDRAYWRIQSFLAHAARPPVDLRSNQAAPSRLLADAVSSCVAHKGAGEADAR
jgi:hypothetical protein